MSSLPKSRKEQSSCIFGEHLTFDGYGGSFESLDDQYVIKELLGKLILALNMRQLSDIQIYRAIPNFIKDGGGWTGFVIIHESHISIHTFPSRGFVSADVYTCKEGLNQQLVIELFRCTFVLKDVEVNLLSRGTKYPVADIYDQQITVRG